MKSRPLIVILGPTASGKTSLGIALARRFHGVILSADSRQVYRGLDAGTAKVTKREMQGVPHYLIDLVSPKRVFTVAQFQAAAQAALKNIPLTTPVFIVGGSPFYIDAITNPVPFPSVRPNPSLRKRLSKKTALQLFALLKKRDPARANNIDRHNRVRIIRALEIVDALGRVPPRATNHATNVLKIGLNPARSRLYKRIDDRVDIRVPGIVAEIKRLRRQSLSWKRMDALGLEYRWIGRYVRGDIKKAEAVERLKGDIHAFARRQLTWWRRDHSIHWVASTVQAQKEVQRFLAE